MFHFVLKKKLFLKENSLTQYILIEHLFCVRHDFSGDSSYILIEFLVLWAEKDNNNNR